MNFSAHKKIRLAGRLLVLLPLPALLALLALPFSCSPSARQGASPSASLPDQSGAEPASTAVLPELSAADRLYNAAAERTATLTVRQLAGQLLMVGLPDTGQLSAASTKHLQDLQPGAVLLFRYNLPRGVEAIQSFIQSISTAQGLPPFISIDHEGGLVFRFADEVTRLPAAQTLGKRSNAAELAALSAGIAASELSALGFTLNLAPVTEAAAGPAAGFLGSRAWSDQAYTAARLASVYVQAAQDGGRSSADASLACAVKHFPGTAEADPHQALASLGGDLAHIDTNFLQPFSLALAAEPAAVVLSLVVVPALDAERPVLFSPAVVQDLLKQRLGYRGIVLSDDIVMKALAGSGSLADRALLALEAGVDMIMISSLADALLVRDQISAAAESGRLPLARLQDAAARVLAQKLRFGLLQADGSSRLAELPSAEVVRSLVAENRAGLSAALAAP
ncbi:MAG: hypothetical protein KKI09_03640 [Spirochaetes bacterium]|nr:hypothetical protein [Spirochaetota bacterium]